MTRPSGSELRAWITLSVGVVAVVAALLQWHASVNATRESARLASEAQTAAFELEAARIVMEQPTCKTAAGREALLVKVFPRLSATLGREIRPALNCAAPKKLQFVPTWDNYAGFSGSVAFLPGSLFKLVPTTRGK